MRKRLGHQGRQQYMGFPAKNDLDKKILEIAGVCSHHSSQSSRNSGTRTSCPVAPENDQALKDSALFLADQCGGNVTFRHIDGDARNTGFGVACKHLVLPCALGGLVSSLHGTPEWTRAITLALGRGTSSPNIPVALIIVARELASECCCAQQRCLDRWHQSVINP